ncbi:MAG: 30S ribosome-binding factor RbfA [bacterium]
MQHRDLRVADAIRDIVAEIILTKIADPKIGFVTITRCSLTRDLRHATVFFSVMGDEQKRNQTLVRLEHARGFIRHHLGKRLKLKFLPELHFLVDEILIQEQRIGEILQGLKPTEPEASKSDDQDSEKN